MNLKQLTSAEQLKALQEGAIHIGIISEPIETESQVNFNFPNLTLYGIFN